MRAAFAFFVATALAVPAFAQDGNTAGLYFGVGHGDFSTSVDEIDDVEVANLDFDSAESASRIFAGWRFNRLVAVQIDRVDFERSVDARDALNVLSTQAQGYAPSVVGSLPLGPLERYARA